jgi:hypothetical protein
VPTAHSNFRLRQPIAGNSKKQAIRIVFSPFPAWWYNAISFLFVCFLIRCTSPCVSSLPLASDSLFVSDNDTIMRAIFEVIIHFLTFESISSEVLGGVPKSEMANRVRLRSSAGY